MDNHPQNFSYFSYSPQNNFESVDDKEKSETRDYNPESKGTSSPCSVQ